LIVNAVKGYFFVFEKAGKPPFQKYFHPSARTLRAHWRGEKCFPPRACRAGKRMKSYFATAVAKLCEAFMTQGL